MTTPSHANAKELVLKALSSNEQTGLSAAQVAAARDHFGWNELATVAPELWQLGPTTNLYVFAAVAVSVLLQVGIIALPFTHAIFDVTTHTPLAWGAVFALALIPVTVIELAKLGRQFFGRSNPSCPAGESS
ncbi:MAG: cation transporting ATPase C-terminal domain-containing protein [Planctomycetota bacterium]|nr:cation transporting ATPase C-terminal domain-containing protein [Planctomycetota bacterium]